MNSTWLVLHISGTRKPASRVFLAPPEGLMKFLSSLYHAWQLLLAKFFDLVKLEFWTLGPLEPPWGQGSNLNSLFRALQWEGFALSIWFGYCKRFLRSFAHYALTNKPKSTRKYLLDRIGLFEKFLFQFLAVFMFLDIKICAVPYLKALDSGKGHTWLARAW